MAAPRDTDLSRGILSGWTLSQIDLAGANFAVERASGRVATVATDAVKFVCQISVGDKSSIFCSWKERGSTTNRLELNTWTRVRNHRSSEMVTQGVFTYVAVTKEGRPHSFDDEV
jgi:acyl-CoA thioesterase YciA